MKDNQDDRTVDLFPEDIIITKLRCVSVSLKESKDEVRVSMSLKGYTNARFETDLNNYDYLNAAAEFLVKQCCGYISLARENLAMIDEKYTAEDLCNFRAGAKKPVISGGNISMTYSTQAGFELDDIIVEKATMVKLIAQWVMMLAKGDIDIANGALNTGYLRIVNSGDDVVFAGVNSVSSNNEARH